MVELHEMSVNYLSKEETRLKHIKDLDQLIKQLEEATIEQNLIINMQAEQIQKMKDRKDESQLPTPVPVPNFITNHLEILQQLIAMFGAVQDVATPYNTKLGPIRAIGKRGKGLSFPCGIVTDGKGNVYIVGNTIIQVISLEGQLIMEFGEGELTCPHSIALFKDWLFVTAYHQIIKYEENNYKLERKSESEFNVPLGIVVDDDEVYVADCLNNRIAVLSLDLKIIREFGKDKLIEPVDVKLNMNKVFVADNSKTHNVHVFSKSGDLLKNMIHLGHGTDWVFLCFDKFNNILISDSGDKIIQIYTLEGLLIHSIKCVYKPTGIAVTQDNIIICTDHSNHKINFY